MPESLTIQKRLANEHREPLTAPVILSLIPLLTPLCLSSYGLGSSLYARGTCQSKSTVQNNSCAGEYSDLLGHPILTLTLLGSVLLHVSEGCDTTGPLPSDIASVRRPGLVCSS